jgi:hypothetical protein
VKVAANSEIDEAVEFVSEPPRTEARLIVDRAGDIVDVMLRLPDIVEQRVAHRFLDGEPPTPRRILRFDFHEGHLSIFPQLTLETDKIYRQKYRRLKEIVVDLDKDHERPEEHFAVIGLLESLPSGLMRDPEWGFGFVREMKPLVHAIEHVQGVTRFVIGEFENTRVERDTFYMGEGEYSILRSGMNRIARRAQQQSLTDRTILAHNASIHVARPDKFPLKERPYEPGTIYRLLGGTQAGSVTLKGKDRAGLLAAFANNASAIARRDLKEFVQLQKDIELVSLDQLIANFELRLRRNSAEAEWQRLLELNPFILSMLFGQPIIVIQAGASVGGQTVTGSGTKIADFLAKNPVSQNAALVELKTPKTPLLGQEYRKGVFGPSAPLMGSVIQLLDQRLKLTTNIMTVRYNNSDNEQFSNLDVSAVECVVVAGTTPTEKDKRTSFELMRSQLKDARVITFDELLERLQLLRELLSGARYVSQIDDDDEFGDIDIELGIASYVPDADDERWDDEVDEEVGDL